MQAKALHLGTDEVVADLGCGTGLFLEQFLEFVAEEGVSVREITAVDLVPDALEKTRAKCARVVAGNQRLSGIGFKYFRKNLEPNRLIPVSLFVESKTTTLEVLRNRIEGLSSSILDRLIANETPGLYALMRGEVLDAETFSRLKASLESSDFRVVLEFNRAARFLQNGISEDDLRPDRRSRGLAAGGLRCSDLLFETLNFGDCDTALTLDFPSNYYTKIVASLFISYVRNPDYLLAECRRMLRPGGTLLISSMKPDSDMSMIFTNYIRKALVPDCRDDGETGGAEMDGARAMLNEAAGLFELEEDGFFRFYRAEELESLLRDAGFVNIIVLSSMGNPPQTYIAVAEKD